MEFRKQYADPIADEALGKDCATICLPEEDMTLQGPAEECDINVMVRRFGVTGQLPVVDRKPLFGDFSQAVDFQTALNMVRAAELEFSKLPSEVRRAIDNDPAKLERWIADPENEAMAKKLGLIETPAPVEPMLVRVIADEGSPS